MIDTKNCPCNAQEMNKVIDKRLTEYAKTYLSVVRFDLVTRTNISEMSLLLSYRRAFINKTTMCTGCTQDLPLETICSRIITLLNK